MFPLFVVRGGRVRVCAGRARAGALVLEWDEGKSGRGAVVGRPGVQGIRAAAD